LPAQFFQALLRFDYVFATHEDVQVFGLPETNVSVHFEGKKRTLQRHYRHACVIQGFEDTGKQLKADNGLHSTGIASFSQLARGWFWYGETGNPFEGSPSKSRNPMAIYQVNIVSPGDVLGADMTDRFLLLGPPCIGSEPGRRNHKPKGRASPQQPKAIRHGAPPES
jgi:hypothetical protein